MKSDIAPVRRAPTRCSLPRGVRDAKGGATSRKQLRRLIDIPGAVAELHGDPGAGWEPRQGLVERVEIDPQRRWQLEQHRSELVVQGCRPVHEPADRLAWIPQTPDVGQIPARLHREDEPQPEGDRDSQTSEVDPPARTATESRRTQNNVVLR